MYTNEELHRMISGAVEGWLPGEGQVFTVTMTPEQRRSLLAVLAPPSGLPAVPIKVDAQGNAVSP